MQKYDLEETALLLDGAKQSLQGRVIVTALYGLRYNTDDTYSIGSQSVPDDLSLSFFSCIIRTSLTCENKS